MENSSATEFLRWFAGGFSTDIEEQLAFYGAYHSNVYNQLIHVVFVPLIWGTACVWLAYSPKFLKNGPEWLNFSFVVYLMYASYYGVLDFKTALLVDAFYFVVFLVANHIVAKEKEAGKKTKVGPQAKPSGPSYSAAKWALVLHVFGWYMQIHPGHAIFEGTKPALLDSFVQSLTLAPLFVFYEVIWFCWPEFQADMRHNVEKLIAERHAAIHGTN